MAIRTELTLVLENKPGAGARVFRHLADEHINILAMQLEHTGLLRLVVDNPLRAAELMRDRLFKVDERDVLYTVMPNDPGALGRTARLLDGSRRERRVPLRDGRGRPRHGGGRDRRARCPQGVRGGGDLS